MYKKTNSISHFYFPEKIEEEARNDASSTFFNGRKLTPEQVEIRVCEVIAHYHHDLFLRDREKAIKASYKARKSMPIYGRYSSLCIKAAWRFACCNEGHFSDYINKFVIDGQDIKKRGRFNLYLAFLLVNAHHLARVEGSFSTSGDLHLAKMVSASRSVTSDEHQVFIDYGGGSAETAVTVRQLIHSVLSTISHSRFSNEHCIDVDKP